MGLRELQELYRSRSWEFEIVGELVGLDLMLYAGSGGVDVVMLFVRGARQASTWGRADTAAHHHRGDLNRNNHKSPSSLPTSPRTRHATTFQPNMSTRPTGIKIRSRGSRQKDAAASANGLPHQLQVRLKVVIRHLPSSLKETEFRDTLKDYIANADYFSWKAGKVSSE